MQYFQLFPFNLFTSQSLPDRKKSILGLHFSHWISCFTGKCVILDCEGCFMLHNIGIIGNCIIDIPIIWALTFAHVRFPITEFHPLGYIGKSWMMVYVTVASCINKNGSLPVAHQGPFIKYLKALKITRCTTQISWIC